MTKEFKTTYAAMFDGIFDRNRSAKTCRSQNVHTDKESALNDIRENHTLKRGDLYLNTYANCEFNTREENGRTITMIIVPIMPIARELVETINVKR